MRNYIILNGNNSNEITGLLIQSLPPISKPLMRTAIEEIDGRDGDIVTNLGYGAYDKEISIGLYGSYDVDEVIKYFNDNMTGQITFSNEPDKYYNYEIINQIDFERLIRFRTAIVTLHCQPFKYPTEETPVEIEIQNITNEAEEMDLDNTADAPMKLDLKGNTSQESEPTPSTPVDINVVSGDNTIEVVGKNVFNIGTSLSDYFITTSDGKYINTSISVDSRFTGSITNNEIVITNAVSTNYPWLSKFVNLQKNTQYTLKLLSSSALSPTPIICGANSNTQGTTGTKLGSISSNVLTFNSGDYDYYWLAIYFGANANTISNIQIEKGNSSTSYEPYQSQTYPINLGELELCKIGDYQDYLYKDNDSWYIHKEIGKYQATGNETITYDTTYNYCRLSGITFDNDGLQNDNQYSTHFIPITPWNTFRNGTTNGMYPLTTNPSSNYQICIRNTSLLNQTDYTNWVTTNKPIFYYQLNTPTNTIITDTELINQLNNLANVKSYDGKTHITQNANDKPFMLNATAVQSGSDTGTVDNEGNIYSKPTLDIEGTGIVAVYLNGNQMFSIDLSNSDEIVIDTTSLEAYNPSTSELMNRQVTGNYDNFKLNVGENTVKISGVLTKATITDYTRWL